MKSPWPFHSREDAELEALQTDVMRFVAILGLCLAAIFSLVHSASQEQQQTQPSQEQQDKLNSKGELAVLSAPQKLLPPKPPAVESVTAPAPAPAPAPAAGKPVPAHRVVAPPPSEQGFSLEFSSANALISLVRQGRVDLYLRLEDAFWRLAADEQFQSSPAPQRIYHMAADTVPVAYRGNLPQQSGIDAASWGVTLPESITTQLDRITGTADGGSLVIHADGSVRLDGRGER